MCYNRTILFMQKKDEIKDNPSNLSEIFGESLEAIQKIHSERLSNEKVHVKVRT